MNYALMGFCVLSQACLDRNPEAFQPKIGPGSLGDAKPRHNRGCNCKRSGCLKNYCECYEVSGRGASRAHGPHSRRCKPRPNLERVSFSSFQGF